MCEMGMCNDAVREIDNAIRINPYNPDYYVVKANALNALGRVEEARQEFEKALELYNEEISLDPYNPDYHSGKPTRIIRRGVNAIKLNPSSPTYHSNKALLLYALKRYTEALREIDEAIKLNNNVASKKLKYSTKWDNITRL